MRTLLPVLLLASSLFAGIEVPSDWLVISPVDRRGRRPFNPDAVYHTYLLGAGKTPRAGEVVKGTRGERAWRWAKLDEKGQLGGRFAWAYSIIKSDRDQVVLASVRGGALLIVNGEPHVGDVYRYGNDGVPVRLQKGANHVFVRGVRGSFKLDLREVAPGSHLSRRDATLPDLVAGRAIDASAAVVVANTSDRMVHNVPAMGVRRLAVPVRHDAIVEAGKLELDLEPSVGLSGTFVFDVRKPDAAYRVTFKSAIDGSVQYYALRAPERADAQAGIVLSLHGAGVHGRNQANCYASKPDLWIVAPTNRRPFGFDWQDWGRQDAYEVLADAAARTGARADRVYLTGHSMGGHGTWHLGANDPDRFLAIAPCAAWESFDTYGSGARQADWDSVWRGADRSGDTQALIGNLARLPVFILHGEADRTVPVEQAKRMEETLRKAGGEPRMHLEPNKGHWYNGPASPGVDCVDWPGIFELYAAHPEPVVDPAEIEFWSADPSIDSNHYWVTYLQPIEYGKVATIKGRTNDKLTAVLTENVRRMRCAKSGIISIDGTTFNTKSAQEFVRGSDGWQVTASAPAEKSPQRSGPFKRAFDRRFVLVHGAVDKLGRSRALYDAERWWYYGNGDCLVLTDAQFLMGNYAGRNVILYGNAESNRAWASVLPDSCPIQLRQGEAKVGERTERGNDLGCFFVYPRRGEAEALVGIIGWTGPDGGRATGTVGFFSAGVGIPDYVLFGADVLAKGDGGVRAAGWFAPDWRSVSLAKRSADER